jgi:signal transduction histidine kinase
VRRLPSSSAVALAAALAVFQVGASFGATEGQPDRRALDAAAVLLLLVGPAALTFRERWPHRATLVAIVATAVFVARGHAFGPVFASPLVGLFAAGLTPRRSRTWALAGTAGLAMFVALAADPRQAGLPWVHLGLVLGWLAALVAVAEVVRNRREATADRARQVADEQRLRIAQELHDVLAHDISLINVQAGVALHLLDEQPEQARTALANIKEASRDALQELRSALDVLRRGSDAPRSPAPRLTALPTLVDGVRAGGLDVHLHLPADLPSLPASVELAAYRIVQEALTNVTRHARASSATVRIGVGDDAVTVDVADDGLGAVAPPGNGITGMRERATSVGGTFDAGPDPGGGFRVRARLPR